VEDHVNAIEEQVGVKANNSDMIQLEAKLNLEIKERIS
jgi:hypothetical protein